MATTGDLTDDLLCSAEDIAAFLGPRWTERRVYHLAEKGSLPVFRLPGARTLYARKSQLRAAFSGPSS